MTTDRHLTEHEKDAQALAQMRVDVERMKAQERALPPSERDGVPNPKFADPIGVHRDGRPMPGYEPPPR